MYNENGRSHVDTGTEGKILRYMKDCSKINRTRNEDKRTEQIYYHVIRKQNEMSRAYPKNQYQRFMADVYTFMFVVCI